jgi:enterochelin esterase family protein
MGEELVPFIDSRYRTVHNRTGRALMGASLGGVISAWTALKYPALFGHVLGQSSAFQIDDEKVIGALARLKGGSNPFVFYLDVGTMEPLVDVNRRVRIMLASKGLPVFYKEGDSGHNWTSWRDRLANAYLVLWSGNIDYK